MDPLLILISSIVNASVEEPSTKSTSLIARLASDYWVNCTLFNVHWVIVNL